MGSYQLDRQHRQLLKLCNALGAALTGTAPDRHLKFHAILHELSEYSRQHFAAEEALLSRYGYPELQSQKDEHLEYCLHIAEQSIAASSGMADMLSLQRYLTKWWTDHILVSDMAYREFLLAQGAP